MFVKKGKNFIYPFLIIFLLLSIQIVYADTSFFENQDDFFIVDNFPSTSSSSGGGGGSGILSIPECSLDSDCNVGEGEVCWDNNCTKLFDMEILEFESPIKTGDFFNFKYLVKAVAEIKGDVEINFWIQKNESIITSGKDTIYFEGYEEKSKTKELFLPEDIDSGTYEFYIEVTYETYTADAHRTIWIDVDRGVATIRFSPLSANYTMVGFIIVIIFLLGATLYLKKGNSKKGRSLKEKNKVS